MAARGRRVAVSLPIDPAGRPSVYHRGNAERVVLLGWPPAVLLQLVHPLGATGVAEHSAFPTDLLA